MIWIFREKTHVWFAKTLSVCIFNSLDHCYSQADCDTSAYILHHRGPNWNNAPGLPLSLAKMSSAPKTERFPVAYS